jgi:transcriptional regulator with XRE-family HTH domain
MQRCFSDEELRLLDKQGLTGKEIAERLGVTPGAVSRRRKRLGLLTAARLHGEAEAAQHVGTSLRAMQELVGSLERVKKLSNACDAWLTDPASPDTYSVEPRADEVEVTYRVEVPTDDGFRVERRKRPLGELLGLLEGHDQDGARFVGMMRSEWRHADPRELILKTAAEVRQTVGMAADLARQLADARIMEEFRQLLLAEIQRLEPAAATRLADALQRRILLRAALPDPLPVLE